MQPISALGMDLRRQIRGVLFDIDDTLTSDGRLTAGAYAAIERLHQAGRIVVPITGRPAGWCDHIARMWPVDAVVGENGAFYFRYDHAARKMHKRFHQTEVARAEHRRRLQALREVILAEVVGTGISSDQAYRDTDLAIDYCEDVPRLSPSEVQRIVDLFEQAGAVAKVSSIHVNGWFGDHDKMTMARIMMREVFDIDLDAFRKQFIFVGDSPNDAPIFAHFPYAVGVANVREFVGRMQSEPAYVTNQRCGEGFAELVSTLLDNG